MMQPNLRPPAVPLVTVDPYFSVWSMANRLTDDFTRHWTGQRHAMTGLIRVDGEAMRFAGKVEPRAERYYTEPPAMTQASLSVTPLTTVYEFDGGGIRLNVRFTSPLLPDDLERLSRPVSYVAFEVRSLDSRPHDVRIYFDVTGEWCVDHPGQRVAWEEGGDASLRWWKMGHADQTVLSRSGDDLRIDWGYAYLAARQAEASAAGVYAADIRKTFVREGRIEGGTALDMPRAASDGHPVMAVMFDCGAVGADPIGRLLTLAYDDLYAVEYFGERLQAYWRRGGQTIETAMSDAFREYESVLARCDAFDRQVLEDGENVGGPRYADLLALAYRQAIAAHKLVAGPDGELLFLSKECYSNGCMATVDVSYPSAPLFLLYNPSLAEGMLRPIFRYAESDAWPFPFAPHDIGQYPLGNGQVYGDNRMEGQMPVEECGNMLILTSAVCLAKGSAAFARPHLETLAQWADYLAEHGLDPEHQLCTDDFAGHLARNANLSAKAVMGIAAFARLLELDGDADRAAAYLDTARQMAKSWMELADDGDHTKLAFGQDGTWSLKYNLIWDELLGTGLFGAEMIRQEVVSYRRRQNAYGTPLDNRATYTKADWLVWSAALAEERDDFIALIEPLWRMLHETPDRVPFSDWTDTLTARQLNFQHRSVIGGIYMKLLKDKRVLRV